MTVTDQSSIKRVVYLWGAGATQAEAQDLGAPRSLLMRDTAAFGEGIATRILRKLGTRIASSFGSDTGIDIEKLISLLSASATSEHLLLAERMRAEYFGVLRTSLAEAKVLDGPALAKELMKMHRDDTFSRDVESLEGFITTNHDGLLQIASQEVFGVVNLGFDYRSNDFVVDSSNQAPPILQLHGSFTWKFGTPLEVVRLRRRSTYEDNVWIPPTILKESKSYPFNKLSGLAYELLSRRCDVLRVVGASLTQNDWNILSLIFNAQRHLEAKKMPLFSIELIMPQRGGTWIGRDCAYLQKVRPLGFLSEGNFAEYKDYEEEDPPPESDLANPFAYWLKEKREYHVARQELFAGRVVSTASPRAGAAP